MLKGSKTSKGSPNRETNDANFVGRKSSRVGQKSNGQRHNKTNSSTFNVTGGDDLRNDQIQNIERRNQRMSQTIQGSFMNKSAIISHKSKHDILSKQFSLGQTTFGSSHAAAKIKHASPGRENASLMGQSQTPGYNRARVKSGVDRLFAQNDLNKNQNLANYQGTSSMNHMNNMMAKTHGNFNPGNVNTSGDSRVSGAFSGAFSGAKSGIIDGGYAATSQPGVGGRRVLDIVGQSGQSQFGQTVTLQQRPQTSGKPGGRRVNFQTIDNIGRQGRGYRGRQRMGLRAQVYSGNLGLSNSSKPGSGFHVQQNFNVASDQNMNVGQFLQNQKSQPIIGRRGQGNFSRPRGDQSSAIQGREYAALNSSGGQLVNSSQERDSSQSPNARQQQIGYLSNLNIVPENETEAQNYDYAIQDQTRLFESKNFKESQLISPIGRERIALNRQSGAFNSQGLDSSLVDVLSSREGIRPPLNVNSQLMVNFTNDTQDAISQGNDNVKLVLQGNSYYKIRRSQDRGFQQSNEQNMHIKSDYGLEKHFQNIAQEKQLKLYRNKVLIDRESTRKIEQRKNSGDMSSSPILGLQRDNKPGSTNFGKLISGGVSEAQSLRQIRINKYMKEIESKRDIHTLDVDPYYLANNDMRDMEDEEMSEDEAVIQARDKKRRRENFMAKMKGQQIKSTAVLSSPQSARRTTMYADQELDVINMIVDKYCDKAEDGFQIQNRIGKTRRQPGFDDSLEGNDIRLGSVLSQGSQLSERETEKKIQKIVQQKMNTNLARIEHLSPRGINQDYENINAVLEELDNQLATKLDQMSVEERKTCSVRLQRSVRTWLKESKFKRFIRDVIKITKLSKIFNKQQKLHRARDWFEQYKQMRDPRLNISIKMKKEMKKQNYNSSVITEQNQHQTFTNPPSNKKQDKDKFVNTFESFDSATISNQEVKKAVNKISNQSQQVTIKKVNKTNKVKDVKEKPKSVAIVPKVSIKATLTRQVSKPKQPTTFKSPGRLQMNTISINIGKDGSKPQGQYVGETSGRIQNQIIKPEAASKHTDKVRGFKANRQYHEKKKLKKAHKYKGSSINSDDTSDDDGSEFLRGTHFIRKCCREHRHADHTKPDWKPNFVWERNDYMIPGLKKKKKGQTEDDDENMGGPNKTVSLRKIKELRRKQFFNFLADFFDKFEAGQMSSKVGSNFKFEEEEKEKWLKRYFMKYYVEDQGSVPEQMVKLKIDQSQAAGKRKCSCTVGQIDEKTGELIPPFALKKNQEKKEKYITVPMATEFATREMKDAQLGFSAGLKTKMDSQAVNNDLDEIIGKKLDKIERKQLAIEQRNISRLSSSHSPTRKMKTPLGQSMYQSAEALSENSPLKFKDSPQKVSEFNKSVNDSPKRSHGRWSPVKGEHSPTKLQVIEETVKMSSLAPSLLQNSVKNRLITQLDDMLVAFKEKQKQCAKGEDFKVAFPIFYEMLCKYSDCSLFQEPEQDRIDRRRNMHINTTIDPSMNLTGGFNQDISFANYTQNSSMQGQRFLRNNHKSQVFNTQSQRRGKSMPRNLTIAFQETDDVPNNFDHKVKPFAWEDDKKQNLKSETSDLLSLASRYKLKNNAKNDFVQQVSQTSNSGFKCLEHGNYKLFGLSKSRVGKSDKFKSQSFHNYNQTMNSTNGFNTTAGTSFLNHTHRVENIRKSVQDPQSLLKQLGLQNYATSSNFNRN